MVAHKSLARVGENHEMVVRLPSDFPVGEVEVVVLSRAQLPDDLSAANQRMLELLNAWAKEPISDDAADDFDDFQRARPLRFRAIDDDR